MLNRIRLLVVAGHDRRRIWTVAVFLALALVLLVDAGATGEGPGAVREVQTWAFPGTALSEVVRSVTSTPIVLAVGVALAVLHYTMRDVRAASLLVVLLVLLPLSQTGLKALVDRPRPIETGVERRASATSPSFPAGHVMGPVVVYGWSIFMLMHRGARGHLQLQRRISRYLGMRSGLGMRVRKWQELGRWTLVALLSAVLLLTGLVNVYLGVHWPTDVIGGYLWGAVLLLPAIDLYLRFDQTR